MRSGAMSRQTTLNSRNPVRNKPKKAELTRKPFWIDHTFDRFCKNLFSFSDCPFSTLSENRLAIKRD